ncbi:hypothetical protein [Streptomyces graminilatus]|uniref:hypothetical protein n=1 Tax=Streptomyces graminilatus TaxID=1464070 RepID=UPI0006E31DEA|nr:hypothetical protein [Streptomyces graminilatus]
MTVSASAVRAGTAGLAVLLIGTGAVACSNGASESPKMTPAAAVAKAAKNVEDITSLTYRMTGSMPGQGQVKADAKMRLKPDVAMSMKISAVGKGADGVAEIRVVDKAMFIGGGAAAAKEMDGKSWIKFDMAALGAAAGGAGGGAMGAAGQADKNPAQESTFLTGSKDVKEVGTETVDGVKTTHYAGTVTLDQFRDSLKSQSKLTREVREKSLDQYEKLGIDKFTMDMWIGEDQFTKQFRLRGQADKGPLDMTITFDDVNKPVDVTAPPAKDVADLAAMMKGAQAG